MNAALILYMLISVALAVITHRFDAFDFRGLGRIQRRAAPDFSAEEDAYDADLMETRRLSREQRRVARLDIVPRADLTTLVALGGVAALSFGAALGFLGPRWIGAAAGVNLEPLSNGAWFGVTPLERVAQIVGATALTTVALRMFRIFAALAALTAAIWLMSVSVDYVLGRPF